MSETNRALIPFTNEHFAAFVQKMIGGPYWYGTCLYKCTSSRCSSRTIGSRPSLWNTEISALSMRSNHWTEALLRASSASVNRVSATRNASVWRSIPVTQRPC